MDGDDNNSTEHRLSTKVYGAKRVALVQITFPIITNVLIYKRKN